MHPIAPVIFGFAAITCTFADEADVERKLGHALQGNWQVVKAVKDGEAAPNELVAGSWLQIKGDQLTLFQPDRKDGDNATFRLDEAKSPIHLDIQFKGESKMRRGIIKLEGTLLTFCFDFKQKDRPKTFEPGNGRLYLELQPKK